MPEGVMKENRVIRFFDNASEFFGGKVMRPVSMVISAILYLSLTMVLAWCNNGSIPELTLFGYVVPIQTFGGIIAQVQVITVVCLVVIHKKRGYVLGFVLLLTSSLVALVPLLVSGIISSLQGIIVNIGTALLLFVIHNYSESVSYRLTEVGNQKEEILALYEEITASEEALINQNHQLEAFNEKLVHRKAQLKHLAYYDPLTGLSNRRKIIDRLEKLIVEEELRVSTGGQNLREFGIVFVDLDNFKKINDSSGHQTGDQILCMVAEVLREIVHKKDMLGRLGGDEFALIIERTLSKEEIMEYVHRIKNAVSERISFGNRDFYVKASYGISLYPQDAREAELLLRYADTAMYEAKSKGTNEIEFFDSKMQETLIQTVEIEYNLRNIVTNEELFLVYQPQYEAISKKLRGFEALARWNSPTLGLVMPRDFIPVAEDTGIILEMGEWILKEACRNIASWREKYDKELTLSINISVVELLSPHFMEMVKRVVEKAEINLKLLEFEVTESTMIVSMDYVIQILTEVKALGINIALDDFGTGYASLSYLQKLPIDLLKIDKAFIDSILEEDSRTTLVDTIVSVGHLLDFGVIAEGVEDEKQLVYLRNVGCDFIQGYLWGRPLPLSEAEALICN